MTRGGWLEAILGDAELAALMGEERQIAEMLRVEAAYARALGAAGVVTPEQAETAASAIEAARIDRARLARDAAIDGMPVPSLSRQLREIVPEAARDAVHSGLTSQDVMDTAMLLTLREALGVMETRLSRLLEALDALKARFGAASLMGRTRMQAALPVGVAHRIDSWARPLETRADRLKDLQTRLFVLQLGGPVGTRESLGPEAPRIAAAMAEALGLAVAPHAWHTDRTALAEVAFWLSTLSGHLGKMGHDLALMAQQGVDAARIAGCGSSSAMAHKANPVRAEALVTLARFNAVQMAGMQLALDHEQERSGASWALEWLILPPMVEATGAGLLRAAGLLEDIEALGEGSR
ncbi:MAG: 3-carboxy-cis,cis-muconate cycloisomerase [Roseovarius sp.]